MTKFGLKKLADGTESREQSFKNILDFRFGKYEGSRIRNSTYIPTDHSLSIVLCSTTKTYYCPTLSWRRRSSTKIYGQQCIVTNKHSLNWGNAQAPVYHTSFEEPISRKSRVLTQTCTFNSKLRRVLVLANKPVHFGLLTDSQHVIGKTIETSRLDVTVTALRACK